MADGKQRDIRKTFTSEGVRGDSVYALRRELEKKGIEEGEFLSKLFEDAVVELGGGAGKGKLALYKRNYQLALDGDETSPCKLD